MAYVVDGLLYQDEVYSTLVDSRELLENFAFMNDMNWSIGLEASQGYSICFCIPRNQYTPYLVGNVE